MRTLSDRSLISTLALGSLLAITGCETTARITPIEPPAPPGLGILATGQFQLASVADVSELVTVQEAFNLPGDLEDTSGGVLVLSLSDASRPAVCSPADACVKLLIPNAGDPFENHLVVSVNAAQVDLRPLVNQALSIDDPTQDGEFEIGSDETIFAIFLGSASLEPGSPVSLELALLNTSGEERTIDWELRVDTVDILQ